MDGAQRTHFIREMIQPRPLLRPPFPSVAMPLLLSPFVWRDAAFIVEHGRGQRCTRSWTTLHTAADDVAHGRVQRTRPLYVPAKPVLVLGSSVLCIV